MHLTEFQRRRALRSSGVDEWLVTVIEVMYVHRSTMVKLNGKVSKGFGDNVCSNIPHKKTVGLV